MSEIIPDFPFHYWELGFDEEGGPANATDFEDMIRDIVQSGIADVFVFSHGWNNDITMARNLYDRFFREIDSLLQQDGSAELKDTIGVVGVIWPSKRWADEGAPEGLSPAVAMSGPKSERAVVLELKDSFSSPKQQAAIERMADLLTERKPEDEALAEFQQELAKLLSGPDAAEAIEDHGEQDGLIQTEPRELFGRFAGVAQGRNVSPAAFSVSLPFERLWDGAKEALRQASYFEMKKRAGVVGWNGLGPWLGRLAQTRDSIRLHLIGHSFGARLVSFALAALPESPAPSPVKSCTLLQGAFSHFAFAARLPHDPQRAGALAGMQARVDGPLLVSHSLLDTAVGRLYPLASMSPFSREDAAALDSLLYRWGAMGHDGAQNSDAASSAFLGVGGLYKFGKGKIVNLDGNSLIRRGGPPSGAHSDIIYPRIAWAIISAAGFVKNG